jgi:gliding motility-associated-like protein
LFTNAVTILNIAGPTNLDFTLNPSACNSASGVISINGVTGGTAPYQYDFNNSGFSSTINFTGLAANSYPISVSDQNGCTFSTIATITSENGPTDVEITTTSATCGNNNGTITLGNVSGGNAPFLYSVNNNALSTNTVFTGLSSGQIPIVVIDSAGCTFSTSTNISSLNGPTELSTQVTNNNCNQSNGSVQVLVTSGTAPFVYNWSNGGTSAIISSLSGGVYSVDVTDANGCVASAFANVNDLPAPILTLVSSQNITCFGLNDGSASISVSGGTAPVSQTWLLPVTLNANPDQTGNGLWPGDNIFKVVDAAGCVSSITVPITEPQQLVGNIAGVVNVTCYNYNDGAASMLVTGGTSPYSFAWSDPASQVSSTALGLSADTFICNVTDANGCTVIDSVIINQPPAFLINVNSITNLRCYGDNNGAISVTASGSSTSYTYSWTPASIGSGPDVNNLSSGSYTLSVTDNEGCVQTADYFISQPDSFNVVSTINPSTCSIPNASISINVTGASPPFNYQWNDPNLQTTNIANGLIAPANYSCLITDSNGCTKLFSAYPTDIPAPSIDSIIATDVRCFGGQDGTLTVYAQVSSGGGNLSYQWLNSSNVIIGNGAFQGGLSAGLYSMIVTDGNGCTISDTGNVVESASLSLTVSQNQTACNGETIGIYANVNNGTPPYTYSWTGAGSGLAGPGIHNLLFTNTTTNPETQTFSVSVTDANNCPAVTEEFSITVLPKISIIVNDNNVCFGQNVTLTASASGGDGAPYEFSWVTNPPQTQTGSSSTISIPVLSMNPQSYNLLVSDGCSTSEMTIVEVIPNPIPDATINAINKEGCEDLVVQFLGNAGVGVTGINYEWNFGDGSIGFGENTLHIYSVDSLLSDTFDVQLIVTSNFGCKDTAVYNDYIIVFPLPIITLLSNSPVCEGDTVVVSATTANVTSYSWSGPNGYTSGNQNLILQNASFSASGNYILTVVDNNNCLNTDSTSITISTSPIADAGQEVEICPGDEITLTASGGTTYYWTPLNNITGANTFNPLVKPDQSQTYTVVVTDNNGCSDFDTVTVLVKQKDKCVFHIYSNFTPNGDNINDWWQIDGLDKVNSLEIHIYNRWGAEVWKTNLYDNKSHVWKGENQKGEPLPDGTYFYIMKVDDEKFNGYVEINR